MWGYKEAVVQRLKWILRHVSTTGNDWERNTLLAGKPLHFPAVTPARNRIVRAEWVEEAVRQGVDVEIKNAIIVGSIDLEYEVVGKKLAITDSLVSGTFDLSYATVERVVNFSNTVFCRQVNFRNSSIKAPMFLIGAEFGDELAFADAKIEGVLDCRATTFHKVTFNRAVMEKSVICEGATFRGRADFMFCSIGANARFQGATFEASALFSSTVVGQDASFNPAFFRGSALFRGFRVNGHAYFDYDWDHPLISDEDDRLLNVGAQFEGESSFNSASFARGAFFDNALFQDYANFGSVKVTNQASFTGAQFRRGAGFDEAIIDGKALFHGARFEEHVSFARATFRVGVYFQHARFLNAYFPGAVFKKPVTLINASCGSTLAFDGEPAVYHSNIAEAPASTTPAALPKRLAEGIDLRGCTYERMVVASGEDLVKLIKPFEPQPLVQLENALRSAGEEEESNNVYYERRRRESKRKRGLPRIGDRVLWALVGYGVRPLRLLIFIVVTLVLGAQVLQMEGAVRPVEGGRGQDAAGCKQSCRLTVSESFWESLDNFLPLPGGLAAGRVWEPTTSSIVLTVKGEELNARVSFAAFASALRLAGWIIVPVGVAGLAGVLQRRSSA